MINLVEDRKINLVEDRKYRNDIDGLRAIAVFAVMIFHFGYLPNGFLGVDVFFVISGFLITRIIYKEINENRFSIVQFYVRRVRRIIPLALFVSLVVLVIGIVTFLPDDLENLAQSVLATNFFSNNILQSITTKNYWDISNDFKPLMHTWSLGVEEQYYFLYPFIFLFVGKKRLVWILPILFTLSLASFALYLMPFASDNQKFYLIFFRFWELSIGGITSISLKEKLIENRYSTLLILLLVLLFCLGFPVISYQITLVITALLSVGILASSNQKNKLSSLVLENKLMVAGGKISFSLYMWHQVILAFSRYFWVQELQPIHLVVVFILTVVLSIISYSLIEQPFRNKQKIKIRKLFLILGLAFLLTSMSSFYVYAKTGVLKDIPELGINKSVVESQMHSKYNDRVYSYDKSFSPTTRIKTLVVGNSFSRDWVNVLLESKYAEKLELSYYNVDDLKALKNIFKKNNYKDFKTRLKEANVVFYATPVSDVVRRVDIQAAGIPANNLWLVGTKNFGFSNGIFYNYRGKDYFKQRVLIEKKYLDMSKVMNQEWGDRYIDYLGKVLDDNQTVPVFTPSHMFISQDCRHFTKAGAKYFAELLDNNLELIFDSVKLN